jgi:hypothetical protein
MTTLQLRSAMMLIANDRDGMAVCILLQAGRISCNRVTPAAHADCNLAAGGMQTAEDWRGHACVKSITPALHSAGAEDRWAERGVAGLG